MKSKLTGLPVLHPASSGDASPLVPLCHTDLACLKKEKDYLSISNDSVIRVTVFQVSTQFKQIVENSNFKVKTLKFQTIWTESKQTNPLKFRIFLRISDEVKMLQKCHQNASVPLGWQGEESFRIPQVCYEPTKMV